MFLLSVCPFSKPSTVRVGMLLFISQAMKADQACIVIFREKTAFRRYMICLFHVLDRLGSLRKIYEYASKRSERAYFFFFTFSHSKTAISFNILLVLQILCLRNTFNVPTTNICTYIVRASASEHIFSGLKYIFIHIQSMQFPLITYGMAL